MGHYNKEEERRLTSGWVEVVKLVHDHKIRKQSGDNSFRMEIDVNTQLEKLYGFKLSLTDCDNTIA